jgi:putative Mg2+ transporter-C (MgtC) family protein
MGNYNPPEIFIEFFGPVNFYFGMGIKITVAVLLGLIIGLDREKKFKSAGVKTQVLICVGSTIYTSIAFLNMLTYHASSNVDPNRLQAQIVSGIGFLGAGAIIQGRGSVMGLTTAATIWTVAAIGIAIGSGYIVSATFFTLTIMAILNLIAPLVGFLRREHLVHVEIHGNQGSIKEVDTLIKRLELDLVNNEVFSSDDRNDRYNYHLYLKASNRDFKSFLMQVRENKKISKITHRILKKKPSNK